MTEPQKAAILLIARKGWASPPDARIDVLRRIAQAGYAHCCGRLFHPSMQAHRFSDRQRTPLQADLFIPSITTSATQDQGYA